MWTLPTHCFSGAVHLAGAMLLCLVSLLAIYIYVATVHTGPFTLGKLFPYEPKLDPVFAAHKCSSSHGCRVCSIPPSLLPEHQVTPEHIAWEGTGSTPCVCMSPQNTTAAGWLMWSEAC